MVNAKKWIKSIEKVFCLTLIVALLLTAVHFLTIADKTAVCAEENIQSQAVMQDVETNAYLGTEADHPKDEADALESILLSLDEFMVPIIVAVLGFGSIYVIVLGVTLAKADGAEKREAAKKRMINFIIGIIAVVLLMALLKVVTANVHEVLDFLGYYDTTTTDGSSAAAKIMTNIK